MTFKLEVGKKYLTREGSEVIVEEFDDSFPWPYWCSNQISYDEAGSCGYSTNGSPEDIVSEFLDDVAHSHYKKDVSNIEVLDVYRVLELFEVRSHAVGHAIKKLLMAGNRGAKDYEQDIQEAIDSLNRELQMKQEDSNG